MQWTADQIARAAWTRLAEPGDKEASTLITLLGAERALDIVTGESEADTNVKVHFGVDWEQTLQRYRSRITPLDPRKDALRHLEIITELGGRFLTPETPAWPDAISYWPEQLDDLGMEAPLGLWVRGPHQWFPDKGKCAALVGSRDSTNYGTAVTDELAAGLVKPGYTVVSGGAYGIDARAHLSAMAARGDRDYPATIAVMAGGLDRHYPAGNALILEQIAKESILVSEVPPGTTPTRWRFLQRNRIIAALSGATVVVEARWRSGALNTATHAKRLGRPVGAVPGSIYSASSAGCHRLLAEGSASVITNASEIIEMIN